MGNLNGKESTRGSKFLVDIHFKGGVTEEDCKQIFDHFDLDKNGVLDRVETKKFLTELFINKVQQQPSPQHNNHNNNNNESSNENSSSRSDNSDTPTNSNNSGNAWINLEAFIERMMFELDTNLDGSLSWEELLSFRGVGLEKTHKGVGSLLQGYSLENSQHLWNEFVVIPTAKQSKEHEEKKAETDEENHLSLHEKVYRDNVCDLVAHILRHERRYGCTEEDAIDLVKLLEARGLPLVHSTFHADTGAAFDVIQEWRHKDRNNQRILKKLDNHLLKLVKQASMVCCRSLIYAIDETMRPHLLFLPDVLQTEILQYLSEPNDQGSLLLKQNLVQLLYVIVWRTEVPGLLSSLYNAYIAVLEECVNMCKNIPVALYDLRTEGADVYVHPTDEDKLEREKSQSNLLEALCHMFHALLKVLNLVNMEAARAELPCHLYQVICFQCGNSQHRYNECIFHVPDCQCHRQITSGCMINEHAHQSLTSLARSVFGLGAKTLLASADIAPLEKTGLCDRPFSHTAWARHCSMVLSVDPEQEITNEAKSAARHRKKRMEHEVQRMNVVLQSSRKDVLQPFRKKIIS